LDSLCVAHKVNLCNSCRKRWLSLRHCSFCTLSETGAKMDMMAERLTPCCMRPAYSLGRGRAPSPAAVRPGSISSVAAARAAATQRVGTCVRRAIFRLQQQQQKQQQLRCREHGSAQTDPSIGHVGPPQLVSIRETRQTAISDLRKARASPGSVCREKSAKCIYGLPWRLICSSF
jgi:hypothetical protein